MLIKYILELGKPIPSWQTNKQNSFSLRVYFFIFKTEASLQRKIHILFYMKINQSNT